MARLRRPGSPWRVLVHTYNAGWKTRGELPYGKSYHFSNDPRDAAQHREIHAALGEAAEQNWEENCLPGTEFDELVVGRWLHVEAQDETHWWMNVGSVTINVKADRDGNPREVAVYGPGDYDDINPHVTYSLTWSAENMSDHKPAHRKPTRWQLMVQRHRENKAQRAIKRHARRRQRRGGGEHVKEE